MTNPTFARYVARAPTAMPGTRGFVAWRYTCDKTYLRVSTNRARPLRDNTRKETARGERDAAPACEMRPWACSR